MIDACGIILCICCEHRTSLPKGKSAHLEHPPCVAAVLALQRGASTATTHRSLRLRPNLCFAQQSRACTHTHTHTHTHMHTQMHTQECGLWRYAAHLTAHALAGQERAEALHRWAQHVLRAEGNMWGAVGILVAAGCLQEALQVRAASRTR